MDKAMELVLLAFSVKQQLMQLQENALLGQRTLRVRPLVFLDTMFAGIPILKQALRVAVVVQILTQEMPMLPA